jgi:HD-GYP domain-containing protein (c-di-GMP phosphodiesterase class II)
VDTCTGQALFSADDLQMLIGISNQIAIAMKNVQLVDDFKRLFESLIDLIVTAIDERSRYTAGHCRRVPILTMLLAEAACRQQEGPLQDFTLSAEELYELQVAALLHDCGKLSIPMYVVDKATKLEAIYDRIHLIDTRFEILQRDAELALLRQKLTALGGNTLTPAEQAALDTARQQLHEARDFLHSCNIGSESMSESCRHRVQALAQHYTWQNAAGEQVPLLSDDEVRHLTILRGTLTPEEREVMNSHAAITVKMLQALPYPSYLRRVPLLAGVHHERMNGTGYPGGYTKDQIPVGGRIMGIADIFEALTAPDRPYKKGKTLMESLQILGQMKLDGHIDPDLFDVFIKERVYQTYAEAHLAPEQIDPVNLSDIPGYTPAQQTDSGGR